LEECNSVSALPVIPLLEKCRAFRKMGKFVYYNIDISKDVNRLREVFKAHKFDTVVNLAQMPSAPYSQIDLEHTSYTIQNNSIGTVHIAWLMKEYCPDAHIVEVESMGTYNHAINTEIPEGKFVFEFKDRTSEPCIFPRQAGSFYHTSKLNNMYFLDCCQRFWGLKSTTINQGVVFGITTPEIEESGIHSHLSYDSTFGTVANRFIIQTIMNQPMTIYGNGNQKRGYLSLNDSIQCLMLFIENPATDMRIVNQLADVYSINQIVDIIKKIKPDAKSINMESPRSETTDDFYYNVCTDTLKGFGFENTRTIEDEMRSIFDIVDPSFLNKEQEGFVQWK
jgi:nucleoside-diphosphate-sugar epimerase